MDDNTMGQVQVVLDCSLTNATCLWDAAAVCAARDFAMTPDDVIDTIGPREDPEIEACVAMLFDSLVRPSSAFDAVRITVQRPKPAIPAAAASMAMPATMILGHAPFQTHAA